ncbi:MAG: CHASE2 domain-containing protein, partial [Desulfofustis sp.]|nr:CHASE2 domain-containing protein [Desulfofustis sp.]
MLKPSVYSNVSKTTVLYIVLLGILVSTVIGFLVHSGALPLCYIDNLFYDSLIRTQASGKTAEQVVVIDVDEKSIAEIGQWPWPRYRIAELIAALADMQPAAIGLDIIFSEPDRTSPATMRKNFKKDFDLDVTFSGIPERLTDNDELLGEVLEQSRTVGANYFYFNQPSSEQSCLKQAFFIKDEDGLLHLHDAPAVLCNTTEINNRLLFNGYINSMLDADGMMRRLPLLIRHDGLIFPNLSLATFMRSLDIDSGDVVAGTYGPILKIGIYNVPITRDGFAYLRFNGPSRLQATIPAADILRGKVSRGELQGKILFIGTSAIGLSDIVPTPVDGMFPGVHTHFLLVDNILNGSTIYKPEWAETVNLVSCVVAGLFMVLLFVRSSGPLVVLFGTASLALLAMLAATVFFLAENVFVSPGRPIIVAASLFAFFSAVRFAIEKRAAFKWYQQLANVQQVTIESMATVAETRDPETGAHIKRTQHYVKALAEELLRAKKCTDILNPVYIETLFLSAPLHDIGKVGVPDSILMKPGKLTDEEF